MSINAKSLILEISKLEGLEKIAEISGESKASIFNSFVKLCANPEKDVSFEIKKKSSHALNKEKTKHANFALNKVVRQIMPKNVNWNATFSEYLEDFIKCNSKITAFDSVKLPPVIKIYLKES
ncbi:hypothetical protein [Pseudomonas syringae]|uniref:hypothetical protein n=1 Tax=Pseudomonas syringae TaxID=317 RepID=UPI000A1F3144|nr:hypothetical protein [Pseudomonas syringae]OSO49014.1 hypothetical protein BV364_00024 [Pseudomonas syringae pv. actinidiae]